MTTTQQELEFKEGERYYIKVELLGEKPVVYTGAEYQRRFKGKYIFLSPDDGVYIFLDKFCAIERNGILSHANPKFPITVESREDVERTGGVENSIELLLAEERFFQR